MICIGCMSSNVKCVDDMLQVGYVAEIFNCNSCGGIIEVEYKSSRISPDNIKNYTYRSTGCTHETSKRNPQVIEHNGKRYPVVGIRDDYYICTDPWEESCGIAFPISMIDSKIVK